MGETTIGVSSISWQKKVFLDEFAKVKVNKFNSRGFNTSFHECLKPVMFVARCASLIPVKGTLCSVEDLEYRTLSYRMFYAAVITIAMLMMSVLSLMKVINQQLAYEKLITLLYYTLLFGACLHFIRMAQQWPGLMTKWSRVERSLQPCEHLCNKIPTKRKIYLLVAAMTIMTLIDEFLSIISGINKGKSCIGIWNSVERYFKQSFPQIFSFVPYHEVTAALAQIFQLYSTFIWNFIDLFIMAVSIGLSSLLRQFNARLRLVDGKIMPITFWSQQKRDYDMLCDLVETIDHALARITVQAFFSNLYYICVQLLNSVNNMVTWTYSLYFWFSLSYLIVRTLGICWFGAEIHTESKKPARILRRIPTDGWNIEAERFLELINNKCVALTGNGYFSITRPFLLSFTGTIVTYELVLMQFNENGTLDSPSSDPCA
ncbi:Gustatory receptor [Sergentomyia squamirostris]